MKNEMVLQTETESDSDRRSEFKAFDDTKAGVKGLVDPGVAKVARIFKCEQSILHQKSSENNSQLTIPTVNLQNIHKDPTKRTEIINKARIAGEKCFFFFSW